MSKLLISEPPLQVLPSLAVKYGLNEAMILQQMHYWLQDKRYGVEKNGRRWIYNSYEDWQKQFPFWSVRTVQRSFLSLEEYKVVDSFQEGTDRRKFYTINYDALDDPSCQIGTMRMPDRNDERAKVAHSSIAKTTPKTTLGGERDLLAESIADCCGIDLSIRSNGVVVWQVKQALEASKPPYTHEEVNKFKAGWWEWKERKVAPTTKQLLEGIGRVRLGGRNGNSKPRDNQMVTSEVEL